MDGCTMLGCLPLAVDAPSESKLQVDVHWHIVVDGVADSDSECQC
jgi:hypothetical protein